MRLTTEGLVIWETKTGEADRVLTILTNGGVITAYAKNSLKPGGRLTSVTPLFGYCSFELYKGRSMYNVDAASDIRQYVAMAGDVSALSLASYLCELLKLLSPVEDDAANYLTLALSAFSMLNAGADRRKIKSAFELKIMSLAGYMPLLEGCGGCGRVTDDALSFDSLHGVWRCRECAAERGRPLNCSGAALAAMKYIASSPPQRVFSFSLPDRQLDTLAAVAEDYVVTQLENRPSTLDFYKLMGEGN